MKYQQFIESSERGIPVPRTTPTDTQKAMAKRDVGKGTLLQTLAPNDSERPFTQSVHALRKSGEIGEIGGPDIGATADQLQKAKAFAVQKELNPNTGRSVSTDQAGLSTSDAAAKYDEVPQSAADRMKFAHQVGDPRAFTADAGINQAINKEIRAGEGETAFEPYETETGAQVARKTGARHLYQPEMERDYGYIRPDAEEFPQNPAHGDVYHDELDDRKYHWNDNSGDWHPELEADDVSTLVGVNMDPTDTDLELYHTPDGEVASRVSTADVPNATGENAQNRAPSAQDMTYLYSQDGIDLLNAVDAGDSQKVQGIAFTHHAGNVGDRHEAVDELLNRTKGLRGSSGLRGAGLDDKRKQAAYGGTFEGAEGELAAKYQIKGAPPGVYNQKQLAKDAKDSKNPNKKALAALLTKMEENREYEVARVYLQQNGKDAYSPHEGHRSINMMDLEHIKALNKPGDNGYDHPSNWVWAGSPLNRGKGERGLKSHTDQYQTSKSEKQKSGDGFKDFLGAASKATKKQPAAIKKAIEDAVPELKFNADTYGNLKMGEVRAARSKLQKAAQKLGARIAPEQLTQMLPDTRLKYAGMDQGFDEMDKFRREEEAGRMEQDNLLQQLKRQFGKSNIKWESWPPAQKAQAEQQLRQLKIKRAEAQQAKTQSSVDNILGM